MSLIFSCLITALWYSLWTSEIWASPQSPLCCCHRDLSHCSRNCSPQWQHLAQSVGFPKSSYFLVSRYQCRFYSIHEFACCVRSSSEDFHSEMILSSIFLRSLVAWFSQPFAWLAYSALLGFSFQISPDFRVVLRIARTDLHQLTYFRPRSSLFGSSKILDFSRSLGLLGYLLFSVLMHFCWEC